eukprot:PhF_6_TR30607/c0_g1_i2/m.45056
MWKRAQRFVHERKYFVQFVCYSFLVTLLCACAFLVIESADNDDLEFLDAWFVAVSCFTCTGLTTVDYTQWHTLSLVVMLIAIELGHLVIVSVAPSLLRLLRLRAMLREENDAVSSRPISPTNNNSNNTIERPLIENLESQRYLRLLKMHIVVNKTLLFVCISYMVLCHVISFSLLVWVQGVWWALFLTVSATSNTGISLSNDQFTSSALASDAYVLIVFILLMHMGNSLYPVFLRMLVSFLRRLIGSNLIPRSDTSRWLLLGLSTSELELGLIELMDNPRLYYTHMFSSKQTMYLCLMWMVLTTADVLVLLGHLGSRVFPVPSMAFLGAVFQAVSGRTTGFDLVYMNLVKESHLLYWAGSMYLSSYPFIISERNSRVRDPFAIVSQSEHLSFDFRSMSPQARNRADTLRGFRNDLAGLVSSLGTADEVRKKMYSIKKAAKGTVAQELGWLYLAITCISLLENSAVYEGKRHSLLQLMFEVIAAYSTVGLSVSSMAAPNVSYTGSFQSPISKFIIMAVMYGGKFRGLLWKVDVGDVERLHPTKWQNHNNP